MIKIKRVYEKQIPHDGYRVLVDRLWPRGVSKEKSGVDEWVKDLAPSAALRKSFGHDPKKWDVFQAKFRAELKAVGRARGAQAPVGDRLEAHRDAALRGARRGVQQRARPARRPQGLRNWYHRRLARRPALRQEAVLV